jgi:hypothetical protein
MSEPQAIYLLGDVFTHWKEGDIDPHAALRALCNQLGEVQSDLDGLQEEREHLRGQISEIVNSIGGTVEVAGFGELRITEPVKTASYDRKSLDDLVRWLLEHDQPGIAQRITGCRKESARAGSLQIRRSKDSTPVL